MIENYKSIEHNGIMQNIEHIKYKGLRVRQYRRRLSIWFGWYIFWEPWATLIYFPSWLKIAHT